MPKQPKIILKTTEHYRKQILDHLQVLLLYYP